MDKKPKVPSQEPLSRFRNRLISLPGPLRYGLGISIALLALILQYALLKPHVETLLYPSIFLVAWLTGSGPALVSILICVTGVTFLFAHAQHLTPGLDYSILFRVGIFAVLNIFIIQMIQAVRVRERRLSDSLEQVKKSQAELRTALRSRDEFLSIASHELKTPLTSLNLQFQLLQRAIAKGDSSYYSPEKLVKVSAQTGQQVNRLGRLIDDMLDVSRIRTGNFKIEKETFELVEIVREVTARLEEQLKEAGTPATIHVSGNTTGSWDRLRLEQVVVNLLTNAIRYGNHRPIEIRVQGENSHVSLTVKDQGIGVAPENRDKIFDRFERGDVAANEISGLGLGLFITRQIVLAHGGRIWVESELGRGSEFHVLLPKFQSDLAAPRVVEYR